MSNASATTYDIHTTTSLSDIQNWISNANIGDIFDFADNSIYNIPTLFINKSINIISSSSATLNGTFNGTTNHTNPIPGLQIATSNINISGLKMQNYDIGIGINNVDKSFDNININNNTINFTAYGIILSGRNINISNNIVNNTIMTNFTDGVRQYMGYGITGFYTNSSNITYFNNTVTNSAKYGIANYAVNSSIINNTIKNNSLITNSSTIGISGYAGIANTKEGNNTIIEGNTVEDNKNYGIRQDSNNVTIRNNTIRNNYDGIHNQNENHGIVGMGKDVKIYDNNIFDNSRYGVFNSGYEANIYNNNISYNKVDGIYINGSGNHSNVFNNNIWNNSRTGIRYHGDVGSVSDNSVFNNSIGVHLFSSLVKLNGNNIYQNNDTGVLVAFSNAILDLFNNTIKKNNIAININGSNNFLGNINPNLKSLNDISENVNGVLVNGSNNIISHINAHNNIGTGFIILKDNNTILTSNIVENNIGIEVFGKNNTINYNRIYKNLYMGMVNNGTDTNANLNWWGRNNITGQYITNDSSLSLDTWYVIQVSANGISRLFNDTFTFNQSEVVLNIKLTTNIPVVHDHHKLPNFPMTINSPHGNSSIIDIRNCDDSFTVYGSYGDEFIINGLSDDEDVALIVKFINNPIPPQPPTPPVPPKPDPKPDPKPFDNPKAIAGMEKTGLPVLAIFSLLIFTLGTIFYRKKQ